MSRVMSRLLKNNIIILLMVLFLAAEVFSKAPKAIITGDEIELIKGGQTVIFTGNAKVMRGKSEMMADRIVQDKKTNLAQASGSIYFKSFSEENGLIDARAGKADFYLATGIGELWGERPSIRYFVKGSTAAMVLIADRLNFNQNDESVEASGNVEIITSSITASAPSAFFARIDKKVILQGNGTRPKISYIEKNRSSEYEADRIVMHMERKVADLSGNVRGKLYDSKISQP